MYYIVQNIECVHVYTFHPFENFTNENFVDHILLPWRTIRRILKYSLYDQHLSILNIK